jgi:peptide/nickel transport system substrate-binding protein
VEKNQGENMKIVYALLALIVLLVVSCGPTAAPSAAPGAVVKPTDAKLTAKNGGTLVVAIASDPGHFNPAITTGFTQHVVADSIFNGLVALDENLQSIPDLADKWDISDGGKTFTFHLHPNVVWHDGQPFTSADVKFSFEQVLLKYHSRTSSGLTPVLDKIETPDDLTVVMRFKQPYGPLLQRLDVTETPIIAKHIYDGQDPNKADANLKPIGTGPFKFSEYVKGDHVNLVRNEKYFKTGWPHLDKVVFKVIPDANVALQALQKGEVDYSWNTTEAQTPTLQSSPGVSLAAAAAGPGGSFCINTLVFNLEHKPLDVLEVRQAISYALDRNRMRAQIHFNTGAVATGPIASKMSWFYNPNVTKYDFSVDKAKDLLDKAGFKAGADGTRFKLVFPHPNTFDKYGEIMREELAAVGITMQDVSLDFNAATDRLFMKRDFDLGIVSYCNGPDPEIGVKRVYDSRNVKPISFSNGAAYKNPQIDDLFDKAAATVDQKERAKYYFDIQDILTKQVPYLWLIETEGARAFRSEFHDFEHWTGHFAESAWTDKSQ